MDLFTEDIVSTMLLAHYFLTSVFHVHGYTLKLCAVFKSASVVSYFLLSVCKLFSNAFHAAKRKDHVYIYAQLSLTQ